MPFNNVQERGRPLILKDEGITLNANVDSLDFSGAGVTATNVGPAVTATIPGATGGGTVLISGTIDDSNTSFTAASAVTEVVVRGISYINGGGVTIVGGTAITLSDPVGTGGTIYGRA